MGQQQLLLLVLGIVIVGLAVVSGIQAFSENQSKANADAMVDDLVRVASEAQTWSMKAPMFGGPVPAGDFSSITMEKLGLYNHPDPHETYPYNTANGNYDVYNTSTNCVTFIGQQNTSFPRNMVLIKVTGTSPDDIETLVAPNFPDTPATIISCTT